MADNSRKKIRLQEKVYKEGDKESIDYNATMMIPNLQTGVYEETFINQRINDRGWAAMNEYAEQFKEFSISTPQDKEEQDAERISSQIEENSPTEFLFDLQDFTSRPVFEESDIHQKDSSFCEANINNSLTGTNGKELEPSVKEEMEAILGSDLGNVKIHTDENANELAETINAKAFAYGQDIYFKEGNYNASSPEGKKLLAHELVHTLQNNTDSTIFKMDDSGVIDARKHLKGKYPGVITSALGKEYDLKKLQRLFFGNQLGEAWQNEIIVYYLIERGWEVDKDAVPLWIDYKYLINEGQNTLIIYTPVPGITGRNAAFGFIRHHKLLPQAYEGATNPPVFYLYQGEEYKSSFYTLATSEQLQEDITSETISKIGNVRKRTLSEFGNLVDYKNFPPKQAILIAKGKVEEFANILATRKTYLQIDLSNLLFNSATGSINTDTITIDNDSLETSKEKFIIGSDYTPAELQKAGVKANNLIKYFDLFKLKIATLEGFCNYFGELYTKKVTKEFAGHVIEQDKIEYPAKVIDAYTDAITQSYKNPYKDINALFSDGDKKFLLYSEKVGKDIFGTKGIIPGLRNKAIDAVLEAKRNQALASRYSNIIAYLDTNLKNTESSITQIQNSSSNIINEKPKLNQLLLDFTILLGVTNLLSVVGMLKQIENPNTGRERLELGTLLSDIQSAVYLNDSKTIAVKVQKANNIIFNKDFQTKLNIDQFITETNHNLKQAEKDSVKLMAVFAAAYAAGLFAGFIAEGLITTELVAGEIVAGEVVATTTKGAIGLFLTTLTAEAAMFTMLNYTSNSLIDQQFDNTDLVKEFGMNVLMFGAIKAANIGYASYKWITDRSIPSVSEHFIVTAGTLQAFAEIHHNLATGESMSGFERTQSIYQNLLFMAVGTVGSKSIQRTPIEAQLGTGTTPSPVLTSIISNLKEYRKTLHESLNAKGDVGKIIDTELKLLLEEQKYYEEYLRLSAKEKPVDSKERIDKYIEEYKKFTAGIQLELASIGLDIKLPDTSGQLFTPRGKGIVEYHSEEALMQIKKLYGKNLKPLGEGMWEGKTDGHTIYFIQGGSPVKEKTISPELLQRQQRFARLENANISLSGTEYLVEIPAADGTTSKERIFEEGDSYYKITEENGQSVKREISKLEYLEVEKHYLQLKFNSAMGELAEYIIYKSGGILYLNSIKDDPGFVERLINVAKAGINKQFKNFEAFYESLKVTFKEINFDNENIKTEVEAIWNAEVELDNQTNPNKVDGIWLKDSEKKAILRYAQAGHSKLSREELIRLFRKLNQITNKTAEMLQEKAVNYDIERLEKLVDKVKGDVSKLKPFLARTGGSYDKFKLFVDYLDYFKQLPIDKNLKPKYFDNPSNEFTDINMQHILDKHTMEHFDFTKPENYGSTVDMFKPGTTQQEVCNYIDEALLWLQNNKGNNYPLNNIPEKVLLTNGMVVHIGSRPVETTRVIGQFYPEKGTNMITFTQEELLSFRLILLGY